MGLNEDLSSIFRLAYLTVKHRRLPLEKFPQCNESSHEELNRGSSFRALELFTRSKSNYPYDVYIWALFIILCYSKLTLKPRPKSEAFCNPGSYFLKGSHFIIITCYLLGQLLPVDILLQQLFVYLE